MTRLYIELHPGTTQPIAAEIANQDFVMKRAKEILQPFQLEWKSVGMFLFVSTSTSFASCFQKLLSLLSLYY